MRLGGRNWGGRRAVHSTQDWELNLDTYGTPTGHPLNRDCTRVGSGQGGSRDLTPRGVALFERNEGMCVSAVYARCR